MVLYEMLCGRTPFQGHGYAAILGAVLKGKYLPPRSLRPDIPPAIEAAIVRAIDRDIQKRFPSAAAMRNAISGGAEMTPSPIVIGPGASDDGPSLKLAQGITNGTGYFSGSGAIPLTTFTVCASTNLATWTNIGVVTSSVSGAWNFTDTNAWRYQRRFYSTTN